jgi:hypothetical protein
MRFELQEASNDTGVMISVTVWPTKKGLIRRVNIAKKRKARPEKDTFSSSSSTYVIFFMYSLFVT